MLTDELGATGYGLIDEQKRRTILGGLDENYDNVFSTFTKRMLNELVILDDATYLLLSQKCWLAKRKTIEISHLPTANMNQVITTSNGNTKITLIDTSQ